MKFDLSNVEMSNRDRIARVKLPTESTVELAEFIGILAGDGHVINYGKQNNNRISISGHLRDDDSYLRNHARGLIEGLFGVKFALYLKETSTTLCLEKRSQGIRRFLDTIGYSKMHCITKIPAWIWIEEKFTKRFIRGLWDTDGALCFKKNHGRYEIYPVIDITLKDEVLLRKVAKWALRNEIPHCLMDDSYCDKRTNKIYIKYKLQISGFRNCYKWITLIGSSNPPKLRRIAKVRDVFEKKEWGGRDLKSRVKS